MSDFDTKPYEPLLDRERDVAEVSTSCERACGPLREAVNYATNAMIRCWQTALASGEHDDVHRAPFALYRQVIQFADAIEGLLARSCVEPAIPLLRSQFEVTLGLTHMLEHHGNRYARRSLACLCADVHQRLDALKRVRDRDVAAPVAARIRQEFIDKQIVPTIQRYEAALVESHMTNTVNAYQNLVRPRRPYPAWYSVYDKELTSIWKLADRLNQRDFYNMAYRRWSGVVHGTAVMDAFDELDDDVMPRKLRYSEQLHNVGEWALIFTVDATRLMIEQFRPDEGERVAKWCQSMTESILNS